MSLVIRCAILLQVGALLAAAPPAPAAENQPSLGEATWLFENLQDEKAQRMLRALLKADPPPSKAELAKIRVYMALIDMNAGRTNSAREELREALLLDRAVELPFVASPKAKAIFQEVAGELGPEPPATAPAPPAAPPPAAAPVLVEVPYTVTPSWSLAPTIVTAAIGLAAVGAGVAFGVLGQNALNSAKAAATPAGTAYSDAQQSQTDSIVADVCYGGAAALGIAAVVLLIAGRPSANETSAAVVPTSGGATLSLTGVF